MSEISTLAILLLLLFGAWLLVCTRGEIKVYKKVAPILKKVANEELLQDSNFKEAYKLSIYATVVSRKIFY